MSINSFIDSLDRNNNIITENDVFFALEKHSKELRSESDRFIYDAEFTAFGLIQSINSLEKSKPIQFKPQYIFRNKDGATKEVPDTNMINEKIIEYWKNRAFECSNYMLRLRYSALVWEFEKKVTGTSSDVTHAENIIQSTLEIILKRDMLEEDEVGKLYYAYIIAIKTSNNKIENLNKLLNKFVTNKNIHPYVFPILAVMLKNKGINNSLGNQKMAIVQFLEENLMLLIKSSPECEIVEKLLCFIAYYYKQNQNKIIQLLENYIASIIQFAKGTHPLQASECLEKALKIIKPYSANKLKENVLAVIDVSTSPK